MGEVADAILNGDFCQGCGAYVGPGDGFPVYCGGCSEQQHEMSGDGLTKQQRMDRAARQFDEALALAEQHGMKLVRHTDVHYQLSVEGGWLLNLYPSKTRIYADRNRPQAPYLGLAGIRWTLIDVVEAVIEKGATS